MSANSRNRRARGELEAAVLEVLWRSTTPLNATEVRDRLVQVGLADDGEFAYTTVVTILTRLRKKGSLRRCRDGRAFRYTPVTDEAGLAARRLSDMLDAASDRHAVLTRFVSELSDGDEDILRALLDRPVPKRTRD